MTSPKCGQLLSQVYLITHAGGVSLFENISVLVEAVETIS